MIRSSVGSGRLVVECERARSTRSHGLPPTILDENVQHLVIAAPGQKSSPTRDVSPVSPAATHPVVRRSRRRHSRSMIPVVAHALIAVAMSISLSPPPVSPAADGGWPLDPRPEVVGAFAPPATAYGSGHRGVDLLGHVGQPVHAAEAGTVTYAGKLAGRGVVVVDHGATRTTYEPVTATVHTGDEVAGGATIGTLELFGSHCFPRSCLHWGLIEGDRYLDPLSLVGPTRVRLLPLFAGWSSLARTAVPLTRSASPPWWLLPQ